MPINPNKSLIGNIEDYIANSNLTDQERQNGQQFVAWLRALIAGDGDESSLRKKLIPYK